MNYENYLLSLRENISTVSKAVRSGVVLTRLEQFDFLFKKELSIIEGIRSKRTILNKVYNNITSIDYRLANFYAEGFSKVLKTIEEGYTVKGVSKQFKSFVRNATSKYIYSHKIKVGVNDLNGKVSLTIEKADSKEVYDINNMNDYIKVSLYLLSMLGSSDEKDNGYREWFNSYLSKEFNRIDSELKAEAFIEKKNVAKDLRSYMYSDIKSNSFTTDEGKVVHIAK